MYYVIGVNRRNSSGSDSRGSAKHLTSDQCGAQYRACTDKRLGNHYRKKHLFTKRNCSKKCRIQWNTSPSKTDVPKKYVPPSGNALGNFEIERVTIDPKILTAEVAANSDAQSDGHKNNPQKLPVSPQPLISREAGGDHERCAYCDSPQGNF